MLALWGTLLALALVPGPSDAAVVARTLASGFHHGLLMVIGIVIADAILVLAGGVQPAGFHRNLGSSERGTAPGRRDRVNRAGHRRWSRAILRRRSTLDLSGFAAIERPERPVPDSGRSESSPVLSELFPGFCRGVATFRRGDPGLVAGGDPDRGWRQNRS